jgi:hypothetical protein
VLVPSVAATAVLAPTDVRRRLVVLAFAAAHVIVTLLAMTAARYRGGRAMQGVVVTGGMSSLFSLLFFGLEQVTRAESGVWYALAVLLQGLPGGAEPLLLAIRHTGEAAWVGVLLAGALAALRVTVPNVAVPNVAVPDGRGAWRRPLAALLALALSLSGALLALRLAMGAARFGLMLFGTLRVGLFVDAAPSFYALPISFGLAGGVVALGRRGAGMKQLGAGLLLWLCAGFAPPTPVQLLYFALGGVLLSRAAQARDDRSAWPERQPWARWLRPTSGPRPARP